MCNGSGDGEDMSTTLRSEDSTSCRGWKALFNFTKASHLFILFPAFLLSIFSGFIQPVQTILFGVFFDNFARFASQTLDGDKFMEDSFAVIYMIVGIASLGLILRGGTFCLWVIYGESLSKAIRSILFDTLLAKEIEWYDSRPQGVASTISRLQTHIRELQLATSQPLGFTLGNIADLTSSLSIAFYFNWRLTLAVIAGVPILTLAVSLYTANLQQAINSQAAASTKATKIANHVVKNNAMVKCHNAEDIESRGYEQAISTAALHYLQQARYSAIQIGFSHFATFSMILGGLFYGGYLIHHDLSNTASVATAFLSCATALRAVENILPNLPVLQKGQSAVLALRQVIDQTGLGRQAIPTHRGLVPASIDGDLEFCDVSFSYPGRPDRVVLHRINFFFPARELSFVIGKSGSGKSTLGNLLLNCYTPNNGSVRIDGTNIQKLDIGWLRNNVTVVSQHSSIFNETISRNISLGRQNGQQVSSREIEHCLDFAVLSKTVSQSAKGIDTQTGANGSNLSGGQIQRIALARAKLRDTPILLLDECTSALDQVTRRTVMRNIRRWRRGKTTIIITHDLSQLTEHDFAYVLDAGSVVAEGHRATMSPAERTTLTTTWRLHDYVHGSDSLTRVINTKPTIPSNTEPSFLNSVERILDLTAQTRSINILDVHKQDHTKLATSRIFTVHSPIDRSNLPGYAGQPTSSQPSSRLSGSIIDYGKQMLGASYPPARRSQFMSMHQAMLLQSLQYSHSTKAQMNIISPGLQSKSGRNTQQKLSQTQFSDEITPRSTVGLPALLLALRSDLNARQCLCILYGGLATLLHAACLPGFSFLMVKLFETWLLPVDWQLPARRYALYMLAVALVDGLASFCMQLSLEMVSQTWIDHLRARAFKKLSSQASSWFGGDKNTSSSICSILDQSAEEMRSLIGRFIPLSLVVIIMMSIALMWSLVLCWKLSLIYTASLPLLYLVAKLLERASSYWENKTNAAAEDIGDVFEETFSNITTVRTLTLESYFHEKHIRRIQIALNIGIRRAVYCGVLFGLSDSMIHFMTAVVFAYAAVLAKNESFSAISILTTLSLLLFSTGNAVAIVSCIPQIASSLEAASRLLRLSKVQVDLCEHIGSIKVSKNEPNILVNPVVFTDLSFWYCSRPETPAISHLNLTIASGYCTAIVGASGSGKSTIAALLVGLIQPDVSPRSLIPQLKIFGHDIRSLHLPTLRSLIAIVTQNPILIPGSVRENILYGDIEVALTTEFNLQQAAKSAGIHDFIMSLPKGYNTILGDGGTNVSGGQAQRIAIARALVRHPKILILDEPTSALDEESAKVIRNTIHQLVQQNKSKLSKTSTLPTTVILITYSVEMMKCADHIVYMDKGSMAEQGSYDDLMEQRGGFWEMIVGESEDDR